MSFAQLRMRSESGNSLVAIVGLTNYEVLSVKINQST